MPHTSGMETQDTNSLFQLAVKHVLKLEGGYVYDPADAGGETNFGISKRQYPNLNIDKLTKADAVAIYHRDYWLAYSCDKLPAVFAVFLFDSAVNHRPKTAVKFLQHAFRVTPDGYIGPKTIRAINQFSKNTEHTAEKLKIAFAYRADFYHDLCVDKPSQERFVLGWFTRLFSLQQFILTEVLNGSFD
jgi:lysozyme family protein